MAMEFYGNLFNVSAENQNYNSHTARSMAEGGVADRAKRREAEKMGSSESKGRTNDISELEKLAPSVEFRVGTIFSSAKSGKTLTINPKLLEKMRNDPEKEKEMKELIKGVEAMTRLSESMNKGTGWRTVFRHSYIDENGKYCHIALIRNEHGYKMSEELRKERWKNAEKLIERTKEKAAKKREELEERKVKQFLEEKISVSKEDVVYVNDRDFRKILKEIQKDRTKNSNAVEVSISEEGMKCYRKRLCENGIKGDKDNIIKQTKQAMSALF